MKEKKDKKPVVLTALQQRFVDAYDGNLKRTAERAGITYGYARRLVAKSHIREAIQKRQDEIRLDDIADRAERQRFWTSVMRDSKTAMKYRLQASFILGRSEGDFWETEKFETGKPLSCIVEYRDP